MAKQFDDLADFSITSKRNEGYDFQKHSRTFYIETPGILLDSPNEKRYAWETLKKIHKFLEKNND